MTSLWTERRMLAGRRHCRYWTSTAGIAECLSLEVERSITAKEVVKTLGDPVRLQRRIRLHPSDNDPEFIAKALNRWLAACRGKIFYIELGPPWENAHSKTFVSRLGDELLRERVWQTRI